MNSEQTSASRRPWKRPALTFLSEKRPPLLVRRRYSPNEAAMRRAYQTMLDWTQEAEEASDEDAPVPARIQR